MLYEVITNSQGQARDGVSALETGKYQTVGKGKNSSTSFVLAGSFSIGDAVVIRAHVVDVTTGLPLANAVVDISVSGPENALLTTGPSDASGVAEATWQTSAGNRNNFV